MLREIRLEDVAEYERDEIVILYREAIWTPDELAEELGLRFLVDNDEPAVAAYECEEEETDPEEEENLEEGELIVDSIPVIIQSENEMKVCETKPKRKRRSPEEICALIQTARELGYTGVNTIAKYTGLSYDTAKKYLAD